MHEILRELGAGARVLDLGSRSGSFDSASCPQALVVRLDLAWPVARSGGNAVQGDAALLPFREAAFDAVIANHSLEHMAALDVVLGQIRRVVRPSGSLFIAVPDAATLSDRLYRWVYHGGGHVNPFRSKAALSSRVHRETGLPLAGSRWLHSSFGFLEHRHFQPRPPRRLWLLLQGWYPAVALLSYLARQLDRLFGTGMSGYGWALYFGRVSIPVETAAWTNVCSWCGMAHPAASLRAGGHVRRLAGFLRWYRCPACTAWNLYTSDAKSATSEDRARLFHERRSGGNACPGTCELAGCARHPGSEVE